MSGVIIPPTGNSGTSNPTVATDQVAGSHYQGVKLFDGTAGSTNGMAVDSSGSAQTKSIAGSQADGHSATIGSTSDGAGASTVVGLLKAIKAALLGTLTTSVSNFPSTQAVSGTVTANAGSGTMAVSQASSPDVAGSLTDGRKTVATPGTAVKLLAGATACKWVGVSALESNTKIVSVGGSDALATAGSEAGLLLNPGFGVTIPVNDVSKVWVDAQVAGEGVAFCYGS